MSLTVYPCRNWLSACVLLATQAAVLPSQAQTATTSYSIGAVLAPPKDISGFKQLLYVQPNDLNDLGQAAGFSSVYVSDRRVLDFYAFPFAQWITVKRNSSIALSWPNTGGSATRLKPLTGNLNAQAFAINNSGWIVGVSRRSVLDTRESASVWRNGQPTYLGAGVGSYPQAISNTGWIVGMRPTTNTGNYVPFIWRNNKIESLGQPPGIFGISNELLNCPAVSDTGLVICNSLSSGYVWRNGQFKKLSYPGAARMSLDAMSPNGLVAGIVYLDYRIELPSLMTWRDGQFSLLPNPQDSAQIQSYTILAVNDNGTVLAGWDEDGIGRQYGLWTPDGFINLAKVIKESTSEQLDEAIDMNNKGQILARVSKEGINRIVVLNPSN